jgi:hypothetical protein
MRQAKGAQRSRPPPPPLDIIVEISYTFYDLFVMMRKHPAAGKAPKGRNLHMCEGSEQWHYYC